MSNLLVVFGATGQQGGSVITNVLNDPELSEQFKIRAITRDVNSDKSELLKKQNVQVIQGDVTDRASLEAALTGAHTVFAMTTSVFSANPVEDEYNNGKTIADVAVSKSAQYLIWSTLPYVSEISSGKYTKITPFDAKAKVERYIRGLPGIKSAFFAEGYFMENFAPQPFLAPKKAADGTWVLARHVFAEPDKYEGRKFCAAEALYTLEEIAAILTRATGQTVVYKQVPVEEWRASLQLPPAFAELFVEAYECGEEIGYFGPGTEELVAWAAANARGRLTTVEEHLQAHPLQLV
ncbi:Uu.00g117320.m01.CDS01 [Anthostomella pinea]|uniref:Uu.00g117320.m01.CDS01 n=1 Tax=Anthostomella pinea TaxID=933095 RepID=A0AAI8VG89_9PEZI|nr:Uu.00g117320.m01.CDS01 [Anthostomella pinea]